MPSWLSELLTIAATTIVAGSLGGYIAGRYALREFRLRTKFETRHQDELIRREAVKDLLQILPIMLRDIHLAWELPQDSPQTSSQHIAELQQRLNSARALFISDEAMVERIERMRILIGMDPHMIIEAGGPMAGARLNALQRELEDVLTVIEVRLYA